METDIKELKNRYISELKKLEKVSGTTISIYEKEIVEFIEYLKEEDALKIGALKIDFYIKKMKEIYSEVSVKRKIASLNGFYKYLQKRGDVETNPFFGIKFVVGKTVEQRVEIPFYEFEKIKQSCDETPKGIRDKFFITLLMKKNIKINDIVNIKMKDVIKKNEICSLKKTEIKVIFLEPCEEKLLEEYLANRDLIEEGFEEKLFKGLTRQNFRIRFQNYCKNLGLKEMSPSQIKNTIQKIEVRESLENNSLKLEKIREEYMRIKIGDE